MTSLGITLLTPWFPANVPLIHGAGINGTVLAFAVAIAVVTACLTGIVPAWPGQSAAGRRIQTGPDGSVTVAGVVGDVRYSGLEVPPDMEIYLPEGLFPQAAITLLVRSATNPLPVAADIRARIAQVDREAFVTDVRTMDGLIEDSLASRSFGTLLLAVCAGIGLMRALTGIYAIVAQAVVQRTFEVGIRLALGATPRTIVRLMVQRSVSPVAAGTIVGLLATTATARLVTSTSCASLTADRHLISF